MGNNFSCIIIDDEKDAIELLTQRLKYLFKNISVEGTYTQWEEALNALRGKKVDLIFMDINMPGKNGINLLKLVPDLESEIIFITAHDNYAIEAFSFSTSGYILKPIDDVELSSAILKAQERSQNRKIAKGTITSIATEKLGIPNNHGIDYINIKDIIYLESINKCTKIVTDNGEYISTSHIGKYNKLTEKHAFFQAHRSYTVNLNKILRYESTGSVVMSNKKSIPVSRSLRNELFNAMKVNQDK